MDYQIGRLAHILARALKWLIVILLLLALAALLFFCAIIPGGRAAGNWIENAVERSHLSLPDPDFDVEDICFFDCGDTDEADRSETEERAAATAQEAPSADTVTDLERVVVPANSWLVMRGTDVVVNDEMLGNVVGAFPGGRTYNLNHASRGLWYIEAGEEAAKQKFCDCYEAAIDAGWTNIRLLVPEEWETNPCPRERHLP